MEKFRLIALGRLLPTIDYGNLNHLISFYPMGAAEFEGSALIDSLNRIYDYFSFYRFYNTDVIGKNKKSLMVFTKNPDVPKKIKDFIYNPYELKRPSRLEKVIEYDTRQIDDKNNRCFDFWYCIDNSDKRSLDYYSSTGDWMACYEDSINVLYHGLVNHARLMNRRISI